MESYLTDICTVPVNIAGICALSMPCGVDSNNLPIGMQIIGDRFCESKVLNAAYKFEEAISGDNYRDVEWGVHL